MPSLSKSILRLRNFRVLLFTRMFTTLALQAQAVIVGWQIYSLTHDPFLLGLTGLTEAVPAIACALFAGHIVDISPPKKVYLGCIAVLFINTVGLLAVAGGILPVTDHFKLLYIFAGVFVSGVARSFIMPASFALLPQIIPRKEIVTASGWLTSGFQTAAICGPALAGLIYGGYGPRGAWMIPTLLLFLASGLMTFLTLPAHPRKEEKHDSALKSIRAGWAFMWQNPAILSVMALDMFAVLFGGAVAMLPAYADLVLHTGSEGLGALRAAPAGGAVIMALLLSFRPLKKVSGKRLMLAITGFGFCMIGFGLSTNFWLSIVMLALSGAFDSVSVIIRGTIMQLITPDHMRGRISAVNSMFIISSNEIGAFESGVMARWLGLVPSVVIGGFATLGIVALTAFLSPKFRKMVVKAEDA